MRNFLNPFDIRKGEGRKTFLMFLYFFLTIMVLYVLKPVRSSLFLEELGSENLRYVYLGEGLLLLFVTWAYVQLAKRLPKKHLFIGMLLIFISNLLLFWWLFRINVPYLSAFFYVWVACFSITCVTQFWTLANDIFDPLEAKRLFGLIISGGSAGGVLGGILTHQAVRWMPTEDLLLLSCLLVGGCVLVVAVLWQNLSATSKTFEQKQTPLPAESTRKLFFSTPYLWMLAGLVLLAKVASTMVDNQFNAVVETALVGKEAKTAFFGAFSAGLNIISFLMQLVATSYVLRLLGIGLSLTLLPVGLGAGSLVTFLIPTLATGTFLKVFDGSMNYSIQQASKEVLYLPLTSSVRYRSKPVIDMLVYRASKSLGGLLIIVLAPLFAIPNQRIGILALALLPFWLFLVWRMRSAYLHLLRRHLWEGGAQGPVPPPRRATEVLSFLYDEKSFENLRSLFTERSAVARKMAAAAYLVYHQSGRDLGSTRRLIGQMVHWESQEAAPEAKLNQKEKEEKKFLEELLLQQAEKELTSPSSTPSGHSGETLSRVLAILGSPRNGMALKKEAAEFLEGHATQENADQLLGMLSQTEEHALRLLLIRTLLHLRDRNPQLKWNRAGVKKEMDREAELYHQIRLIASHYLHTVPKREEFPEIALKALGDECFERLFGCLGLLFPSEGVRIIGERLLEHPRTDPIRSHAIELLHNLLGAEFYGMVEKLLDEGAFGQATEAEAVAILERMIASQDRWLSLVARFLVAELKLGERWPQLGSRASTFSFESLDL